jgi:nitrate reductase beta subunit
MCVTACPYKKTYFNWKTGKSEKCMLCYPRIESGQIPACMHSCVGRIRYLGALLYDADKIKEIASCELSDIVDKQKEIYLDPFDDNVIEAAKKNGIDDLTIEYAQKSPVWKFVKEWGIALPLHPEFRTIPNLFYVPPLLPTMGNMNDSNYESISESLWAGINGSRLPIDYLASLFSAGNTEIIRSVLKKLMAVRLHRRDKTVGDLPSNEIKSALKETNLNEEIADEIFRLTSIPRYNERIVIPPAHKEEAKELIENTHELKGSTGFGFKEKPDRIL